MTCSPERVFRESSALHGGKPHPPASTSTSAGKRDATDTQWLRASADGDWLHRWWRRRVHALPTAGAWPSGGTCISGDLSVEGRVGDPGSPCACGMADRESLPTWFCGVANGTWGRCRCILEGCGPVFCSAVSALYHMPKETLCSLLTPITAPSTSANCYTILF